MYSVLHKAGIESPDWVRLTQSLGLDSIILPAAFFNQWTVVADDRRPSWKTLAKALGNIENFNYKQATVKAFQMEGMYSICSSASMHCIGRIIFYQDKLLPKVLSIDMYCMSKHVYKLGETVQHVPRDVLNLTCTYRFKDGVQLFYTRCLNYPWGGRYRTINRKAVVFM